MHPDVRRDLARLGQLDHVHARADSESTAGAVLCPEGVPDTAQRGKRILRAGSRVGCPQRPSSCPDDAPRDGGNILRLGLRFSGAVDRIRPA
jgi:uncharacterized Zn-binding protein involved in type VI secretion